MGKAIRRVHALSAVLMLAALGFFGVQPAMATQTEPGPGTETEQPVDPGTPTVPVVPPVVTPPTFEPAPNPSPVDPGTTPAPVEPPAEPSPVVPPAPDPVAPPAIEPVAPLEEAPAATLPTDVGVPGYVVEPEIPTETTSAPAEATPTPTPTPLATKTAAPPVMSSDITGPLKVALAPVAENNPIVQGVTVLVLVLLGVAYFRALRSKGASGPRLNGK